MGERNSVRSARRRIVRVVRGALSADVSSYGEGDPIADELAKRAPGACYERVFAALAPAQVDALVARAKDRDGTYVPPDFHSYYFADVPHGDDPAKLDAAITLERFKGFVNQLRELRSGSLPSDGQGNSANQFYVHRAPKGTHASCAWDCPPGGRGAGVRFADVEMVLPGTHVCLPSGRITRIGASMPQQNGAAADHATAVLGIVLATVESQLMVGAAWNVDEAICVSSYMDERVNTAGAVMLAASKLGEGDVLLIEHQNETEWRRPKAPAEDGTPRFEAPIVAQVPVECDEAVHEAIRLATALGIVVVEPGGNGAADGRGVDIDSLVRDDGTSLDPAAASYRDSGAIVVSAARYNDGIGTNTRLPWAPYGDRVDCFARGTDVWTCRGDEYSPSQAVRGDFGGTSAAAAIIAGTALQVQGIAKKRHDKPLTPTEMRDLFRNRELGSEAEHEPPISPDDPPERLIGRMPDLERIVPFVLT